MRPWQCSQTDRYTHTQTDANRFYNLSHAICYSYGTENEKRLRSSANWSHPTSRHVLGFNYKANNAPSRQISAKADNSRLSYWWTIFRPVLWWGGGQFCRVEWIDPYQIWGDHRPIIFAPEFVLDIRYAVLFRFKDDLVENRSHISDCLTPLPVKVRGGVNNMPESIFVSNLRRT